MTSSAEVCPPEPVVRAYRANPADCELHRGGLINRTFMVRCEGRPTIVLQKLHPIFAGPVNVDLDVITTHLAQKGAITPRLVPTEDGQPWVEHGGEVWRAISYIDGVTMDTVPDRATARAAGELVGRFHQLLDDLDYDYAFTRAGVHDTDAHLGRLASAMEAAPDQPLIAEAISLGRRILASAEKRPDLSGLPLRHCHGDLKISNVLFERGSDEPRALCLIDLDTLARQSIAYELGDALRSWCNRVGEDTEQPELDLDILAGAVTGYAQSAGSLLSKDEVASILPGLETVALELAARFACDAIEDRYFGWNPDRFDSRRHHNLVRARGQLALSRAVAEARADAATIIGQAFAGT